MAADYRPFEFVRKAAAFSEYCWRAWRIDVWDDGGYCVLWNVEGGPLHHGKVEELVKRAQELEAKEAQS